MMLPNEPGDHSKMPNQYWSQLKNPPQGPRQQTLSKKWRKAVQRVRTTRTMRTMSK